jgi:hypothetical protein
MSVTGSTMRIMPVSNRAVVTQIVFDPDIARYSGDSAMM